MNAKIKLQVDLADPDDLRAKVAEAEEIWAQKRQLLREVEGEVKYWEELVASLKRLGGTTAGGDVAGSNRPSPAQDAVVEIVEREGRPMRPIEVTRRLREEGQDVKNAAVNAALYAAAEAGRLRRPGERQYAPRLKKVKKVKKPPRKTTS